MPRKSTLEEFVRKGVEKHGEFYDYSRVVYTNNKTPVEIMCPIHGVFWQRPDVHLRSGCMICGIEKKKGLIRGVAINDTLINKSDYSFRCWLDMLRRCYPSSDREKYVFRAYKDCFVDTRWLTFSNFLYWFDKNYHEGYALDKDLLSHGNKIYSPDTCCFIPPELNSLLQTEHVGMQTSGKRFYNSAKGRYEPKLFHNGKTIYLGKATNEKEAISLYIDGKEKLIRSVAKEYFCKGLISENIYYSFLNYKVNYANY